MFHRSCSTWSQLLRLHAPDSSDPVTALRFGDRSKRRRRHHVLFRADHLIVFTLAGWIPPAKWTLVSCRRSRSGFAASLERS
jgi:hypothetical protein